MDSFVPWIIRWKAQEEATSRGLSESFILKPKCWDELTKCQTPQAYWWFVFIMLVKLIVNAIALAGDSLNINWGMWLQILLISAALISHYMKPYTVDNDNTLEQVIFLSLATTLSIMNSGVDDSGGWQAWDVLVVAITVSLATIIGLYPTFKKYRDVFEHNRRVQANKSKHCITEAFNGAIPSAFNNLSEASKEELFKS